MRRPLFEYARAVLHATALRVIGTEDKAAQTGESDGLRAHGAGFERYVETGVLQPFGAEPLRGIADRQQFGMRGRIVQPFDQVVRPRQNPPVRIRQHRADRHLAGCGRSLGLGQGQLHEIGFPGFLFRHGPLNTMGLALGQASR